MPVPEAFPNHESRITNHATKLAIVTTHPIQYQVPWFRALALERSLELTVGYACMPDSAQQGAGFDVPFAWDLPLLDGYRWEQLNLASAPAKLNSFAGLRLHSIGAWFRRGGFDAVLVTGWNSLALVQAALAASRLGIPLIGRGDSHTLKQRSGIKRFFLSAWLHRFSAFLVVGSRNRDFYREAGIEEERLFDGPHFVDNDRFGREANLARQDRAAHRARLGIPEKACCVLFAGKMIPEKNLGELLEAVQIASVHQPNLHLLMVGDGPLRKDLEREAALRSLPVKFAGFLNQREMPAAYAEADVLALTSVSESWGLVVNEAMASGLPAIVSDRVGCSPDLVSDGSTGWTYTSGNAGALATVIERAVLERDQLPAMGAAARKLVNDRYSVDRAVEGTLEAVEFVTRDS